MRVFLFLLALPVALVFGAPAPAFGAMDARLVPAQNAEGLWGYVDAATGRILIAPRFGRADFFYDGFAIVASPEGGGRDARRRAPENEGVIDTSGREILPPLYAVTRANTDREYPLRGVFVPRLFLVEGADGKSLVLRAGKGVIVPAGRHERIRFTAEGGVFCDGVYYTPEGAALSPPAGCAVVVEERESGMFRIRETKESEDAREGLLRPDGSLFIPVQYHDITVLPKAGVWLASRVDASIVAAFAAAMRGGKLPDDDEDMLTVDVYDASGRVLRSFRAREIPDAAGEHYEYRSEGRAYRVHAATGRAAPEHGRPAAKRARPSSRPALAPGERLFSFNHAGQAVFSRADGMHGVMDRAGGMVLPCEFSDITDDSRSGEVLYRVRRGTLWGLYDGAGRELIPCRYGYIDTPGEAWVRVEAVGDRDTNGLVNFRTGQVIPPKYTLVRAYPGCFLAYVHGNDAPDGQEVYILLDARGRERGRYQRAEWFAGPAVFAARQGRKYALLDAKGTALTPFQYDAVSEADGAFVWGRREGKRVLLDARGKERRIRQ